MNINTKIISLLSTKRFRRLTFTKSILSLLNQITLKQTIRQTISRATKESHATENCFTGSIYISALF